MKFQIGSVELGESPEGPDPGPKSIEWHKVNVVKVKEIPGLGKKFITVRTSDGVLWECDLTVRSITWKRYNELKDLTDDGGPFLVTSFHGLYRMYVIDATVRKKEGDADPPIPTDDGTQPMNVAEWVLKLLECND